MDELTALKTECLQCHRCALSQTRTNVVFGTGNPHAKLLFIGEGPGAREDEQGEPFVGAAGQLLNCMLAIIGLRREDVYIANIVKCRPPQNRDPKPEEQDSCISWLEQQIALINPRAIVCLGRIAAQRLIAPDFRITRNHGVWYQYHTRPICATFHPAALLRNPENKALTLADLYEIEKLLNDL